MIPLSQCPQCSTNLLNEMTAYELKVEGMSFAYPRRPHLIKDLNTTFRPGATVLLGPNGAGKTTLLSLLATIHNPNQGSIRLVDSENEHSAISSKEIAKYRQHIAWLPQRFEPVSGLTVKEHVAYSGWLKGIRRYLGVRSSSSVTFYLCPASFPV
ncbi:hypothetical protein GCM10007359_21610 [Rothia aerolata]|uniref:ABC transporter domain-containing protein n=2 Tax=Rothia aerolata TaxID=1812262 RepID=A0A917IXH4_9MICC|nr:hypothetical protein GCM10007359_21610 [Rothia aerolata]